MAAAKDTSLPVRKVSYASVHKFAAAVSLLCFVVIVGAGLMAETSVIAIAYRSMLAILVVGVISRVVVSILATYEEMNSGQS